jgi:coenzyme PQQ precursor peptide PqqA
MEWVTPDFEEVMTSAEMTAYAGHWTDEEDGVDELGEEDDEA